MAASMVIPLGHQPASETRFPDDTDDLITGQDDDGVVTVVLTGIGGLVSVRLTKNWKSSIDPAALPSRVLAALAAATVHVTAEQAEQVGLSEDENVGINAGPAASDRIKDETPITEDYTNWLLSTVSADLNRFLNEANMITNQVVTTQSTSGNVSVSGRGRCMNY